MKVIVLGASVGLAAAVAASLVGRNDVELVIDPDSVVVNDGLGTITVMPADAAIAPEIWPRRLPRRSEPLPRPPRREVKQEAMRRRTYRGGR